MYSVLVTEFVSVTARKNGDGSDDTQNDNTGKGKGDGAGWCLTGGGGEAAKPRAPSARPRHNKKRAPRLRPRTRAGWRKRAHATPPHNGSVWGVASATPPPQATPSRAQSVGLGREDGTLAPMPVQPVAARWGR